MAAANKPIWVQVAEAGFGDRLAELGWKQVSPAHWRLDGDGVIWRTLLDAPPEYVKEYEEDISGCFADESGFELAGLDDLVKRLDPDDRVRWLNPMIRRNVRVHLPTSIGGEHYDWFWRRRIEWMEANPPRKASIWERLWYLSGPEIWSGPAPPMERLYDVEPAYRTNEASLRGTGFAEGWWDTTELGVEDVSARLTRHWEAWMKPRIDAWMTGRAALAWSMLTEEDPDSVGNDLLDVYAHYVVGDLDYCRRRLRAEVNRKVPTLEEKLKWLKKVRFFGYFLTGSEKEKRETAQMLVDRDAERVLNARHAVAALELSLD